MAFERPQTADDSPRPRPAPTGVRLRTLVLIRWIAIGGQAAAILAVELAFGYPLPLGLAFAAVMASALFNVWVSIRHPAGHRLDDRQAAGHLAFDVLQLAALLSLTGGLTNPFAVLILAPATIAATMLGAAGTIGLILLGLLCIAVLAVLHLPLPWPSAAVEIDGVYVLGNALALALGVIFLGAYVWRVARERRAMADALQATQGSLARAQRLAALDGLAANAAHELGTPLGTIALVAREIERALPPDHRLAEDVRTINAEAKRCGEILARLGRESRAGTDAGSGGLALTAFLAALADEHRRAGVAIEVATATADEPRMAPRPEVTQALGNLIDNAIEFADGRVHLAAHHDAESVTLEIGDNGPGFARDIIGLLGEPFVAGRDARAGSGLGVFIAVTLLERTGAGVRFANGPYGGALVRVRWSRAAFEEFLAQSEESENG